MISYVVTGAGQGIGRAIAQRLARDGIVVVLDRNASALQWVEQVTFSESLVPLIGNAADDDVLAQAAELASERGRLAGWVNNAALFRDLDLHTSPTADLLQVIHSNLAPALAGSRRAVATFLAAADQYGGGGAIVNVSSHQASRAVPGALAYVVAKAAIEGLTRACAVDYGAYGIRCNAVALGSIETERSRAQLDAMKPEERGTFVSALAALQPVKAFGSPADVASVVAFLLSSEAGFVNGAVVPVDGGRSARGADPESRRVL